ncbi:MAG: M15 family metallopeptidase [Lawsonibacter sp.]|jgi:LAS superfamily LD-carboxypeptidase LdcB|nr:M15 family metallopeptidase [Lawsonibacter sp.]
MDNSVTRRLASFLLAGGLCLTPLIAARAAGPEAISAPPPEELALELWNPLAFLEEEPTAGEEEIPALLLIREGLTEEQQEALAARMEREPALLERLEKDGLSDTQLVLLALPSARTGCLDRYLSWAEAHPEDTVENTVFSVNADRDLTFYGTVSEIANPSGLGVLVNKHHVLPAGYVPELEALGAGYGYGSLRPEAARAFRAMADAARAEGVSLRSVSAYRSYAGQKVTYNNYLKKYKRSVVDSFSARPGHSEHQTGLALDINAASSRAHFENTPAFAWLKEHCAEYGFILRYDQGKEAVTGYRFEPWHYRYVGVEAAKACMEQGLCYEEYLALLPG